jgi:hypothetical protein
MGGFILVVRAFCRAFRVVCAILVNTGGDAAPLAGLRAHGYR